MPRTQKPKNKPARCRHDGSFAVVSGIRGENERTMSEPAVVCCRCGALRRPKSWKPDEWSEALGDEPFECPNDLAMLVHETNVRAHEDANEATRRAWERWVDVGGYGRRLLFGRLRAEEIGRAESDAAAHARETGR